MELSRSPINYIQTFAAQLSCNNVKMETEKEMHNNKNMNGEAFSFTSPKFYQEVLVPEHLLIENIDRNIKIN